MNGDDKVTPTVLTGQAVINCPACGISHESEEFSYGRHGQGSYCPECAEELVPQEERDIIEALNTLDIEVWAAHHGGADKLRMAQIAALVLAGAEHIARKYSPADVESLRSWINADSRARP